MGPSRALTAAAALLATTPTVASGANAAVRFGGACMPPGTSVEATTAIIQAELPAMRVTIAGAEGDAPAAPSFTVVVDGCTDAPPGARVTVYGTARVDVRAVDLDDVALDARDRTLALTVAESIRRVSFAKAAEAPPSAPAAPPLPPPPSAPTRHERSADPPSFDLYGHGTFRYVTRTPNPAGGFELGVAHGSLGVALLGLGAWRTTSAGTANVYVLAVAPSADIVAFGPNARLVVRGELGFVSASGDPAPTAAGHSKSDVHAALAAGIAPSIALGAGLRLEGFLGGGFASSLTARAAGRDAGGFDGVFIEAGVGARLRTWP
jgi:hypothetical protein